LIALNRLLAPFAGAARSPSGLADAHNRSIDLIKLERPDNRFDLFHMAASKNNRQSAD
jgi:hypothetical protein